jgi:hypothetical protein
MALPNAGRIIILKMLLKKRGVNLWIRFTRLEMETSRGLLLGTIMKLLVPYKTSNFLTNRERGREQQLHKKYSEDSSGGMSVCLLRKKFHFG